MPRFFRSSRRRFRRYSRRPSDRIVRAGQTGSIPASTQVQAYFFQASEPLTATRFRLDTGAASSATPTGVYCLVYVPEGYDVNDITFPAVTDDLYNPTKNVLISGVLTQGETTEDHKFSSYSRKLATGDRLALVYYNTSGDTNANYFFELSFTTLH